MRIEYKTVEDLLKWLKGKEEKYEIYVATITMEVIALPLVSTRPVKIGTAKWGKLASVKEVQGKINEIVPELRTVSIVESVDYQVEK